LNRAIRRPARPCRKFLSRFRRGLPYMAFEVPLPLSTSEASGRGPPAVADKTPDHARFVATKVVAKSADVLSRIATTKSGDLARGRFSPDRCGTRLASGERNETCIWLCACNHITPRLAVAVLTGKGGAYA
jgi:hypothetical protein